MEICMLTRRLSLLGIAAAFVLGACSSSGAATTAVTTVPATAAATTTIAAPVTTAAPTTTAAAVTSATTTATANSATVTLISQALVTKTGGKLSATDATCIATGLLGKYDLSQLAAMQTAPVTAEVAAVTAVVIETCVGPDHAAEVSALLAASV
jgi:hypothetical protein